MRNNKFLKIIMMLLMSFTSVMYIPNAAAGRTSKYSTYTNRKRGEKRYNKRKQNVSCSKNTDPMLKKLVFLDPTLVPHAPQKKVAKEESPVKNPTVPVPPLPRISPTEKDEPLDSSEICGHARLTVSSETNPAETSDDDDFEEYWEEEKDEYEEEAEEEEEGEEEEEEEEAEEEKRSDVKAPKVNSVNIAYIDTYIDAMPCPTLLVSVNPNFSDLDSDDFANHMFQEIQDWKAKLNASGENLYLLCIPKRIHSKFVEKSVDAADGYMEWYTLDPEFLISGASRNLPSSLPTTQRNLLKVGYDTDGYLLMFHESFFPPDTYIASTIAQLSLRFLEYISDNISLCFTQCGASKITESLSELKPILTNDDVIEGINQMTQSLFASVNGPWDKNFFQNPKCQQALTKLSIAPTDRNCRTLLDKICGNINFALRTHNFDVIYAAVNHLNLLRLILAFTSL